MQNVNTIKVKKRGGKSFWQVMVKQKALIWLVLPGVIYTLVFDYIPMYGVVIAFQDFNAVDGFFGSKWVGMKYFNQFFRDPYLFRIVKNTVLLGVYSLLWSFPAPIILALLLDQLKTPWYKRVVQTISYLPYFISTVVIVGILRNFVSIGGLVNQFIVNFGGDQISFLTEPQYFRTLFISSGIWQEVGWGSIMYLAALTNVDPQLHEAAIMDGANRWQRVKHITWPSILPTTSIMLIFSVSGILGSDFQKALLLGCEATYETSDLIGTYTYRVGIQSGRFEYGAAIGLLMSLASMVLLFLANFISKRLNQNSLW